MTKQATAATVPETLPRKKLSRRAQRKTRPKRQPPYAVILHNDEFNSMEFVVTLLRKVLKYSYVKCVALMLTVHFRGRANVWSGTRELAELKLGQLQSAGSDPQAIERGGFRLQFTIEPLP